MFTRPSKVLLAFTAFKDSLSAEQLCDLVSSRLTFHNPALTATKFPISDGGDGFLSTIEKVLLRNNYLWTRRQIRVTGPLGAKVTTEYGVMRPIEGTESVGVIEIAKISGLEMVPLSLRNVMRTTNHGIGDVLRQLRNEGIRKVILGLGGSSTIDAGMSILYALPCFHFRFDDGRRPEFLTGADLGHIRGIEKTEEYRDWADLDVTTACDVKNTLLGPEGAVYMFGQQKGLQTLQAPQYEDTMRTLAAIAGTINNIEGLAQIPHTGAAGGILVGLKAAFPLTSSLSGFDLISQLGHLPFYLSKSDFVFTGEGKYDAQTSLGKVVHKIRTLRPDAIIICGQNTTTDTRLTYDFLSRFGLKEALNNTEKCLQRVVDEIVTQHMAKM